MSTDSSPEATIEADPDVPLIRISRVFKASAAQLIAAHTDPDLFVQWIGPDSTTSKIDYWDGRTGGSYRYVASADGGEWGFYGSFHYVGEDRLTQTFTFEGFPEGVSLETMTFEDLGDGCTRLNAVSLVDSFEARDAMLSSGMEVGINEGYRKLDGLLRVGTS